MSESLDQIVTERLRADRLQAEHLPSLLRMDGDPRVMNNIGGVRTEEESREYMRRNIAHWDEHGFGLWMLFLLSDRSFVGRAALRRTPLGSSRDENVIGYALLPEYWGMGLATEIVTAIVELAFTKLGMKDVAAGALPENVASRRVMEKAGGVYDRVVHYKNAPHVMYRFRPS